MRGFLDLQTRGFTFGLGRQGQKVFVNGVICSVFACRITTQEGNIKNEKIDSVFEPRSATL